MKFVDARLKIRHWFRKYKKLILILFLAWFAIFMINYFIGHRKVKPERNTTYEAHTSVIDSSSSVPQSIQTIIEEMIKEYIGYCNEGNYQMAFDMLSEECRKHEYKNSIDRFMNHVLTKMPVPKKYAIQDYSNPKYDGKTFYIYEIKYTDDLLATGLTNSVYSYTSEKMAFYKENDEIKMSVGDYIYTEDVKRISENEYLKVDVMSKSVSYSSETYEIKFTNRSNYTIVIADGVEANEINLVLPNETRQRYSSNNIVLEPRETMTYTFEFPKYVDDGDTSQSILFSSIRVMENYSGTDETVPQETIQSEIDNAISKFSTSVGL